MKKIIFALVAFSLMACEKTIDFELPVEEPQLAVSSKIIASDSIYAAVSISSPALSGSPRFADDATVVLYEDGVVIDTLDVNNNVINGNNVPLYTASYPFVNERTYTLKVSKANFESVQGSCIVPSPAVMDKAEYFSETRVIKATIDDQPGKGDIYKIEITLKGDQYSRGFTSNDLTMEFYEGYSDFLDLDTEGSYGTRAYIRDELFDGGQRDFELTYYDFDGGGGQNFDTLFLKITTLSIDQYEFEKTLDLGAFGGESPFAEPITIYSNMSNGKGNFGAENGILQPLERK